MRWSAGDSTKWFLARIKMAEISASWTESKLRTVDLGPLREILEQSLAAEANRNGAVVEPSLLDVAHAIRNREALDPRDRVFALMSLATPAEAAAFDSEYCRPSEGRTWDDTTRRFFNLMEKHILKNPTITLKELQQRQGQEVEGLNVGPSSEFPR